MPSVSKLFPVVKLVPNLFKRGSSSYMEVINYWSVLWRKRETSEYICVRCSTLILRQYVLYLYPVFCYYPLRDQDTEYCMS